MCCLYDGLLVDIEIPVMPKKKKEKVASESMVVKWG
jgi:hypothetical protein